MEGGWEKREAGRHLEGRAGEVGHVAGEKDGEAPGHAPALRARLTALRIGIQGWGRHRGWL
jgi:hypothetical protein